jgi:hypothetical protein
MTNIDLVAEDIITNKIIIIRGRKVMLDKDIALLYNVKPIVLRQQVKRNIERFPEDFMFILTESEIQIMVSQNVIPSKKYFGGSLPYVFTEQRIAMLSSVLRSKRAISVNVTIMRTFVKLRKMISSNDILARKILELESKYDAQFSMVFDAIRGLMSLPEKSIKKIGFKTKMN